MKFFIFSFNRGEYLKNCVESIECCAPQSELVIFDDASTDPHTRKVLTEVAIRHTVINRSEVSQHKHGGLYANMQSAFETLQDDEIFCFLQDDCQLVRQLFNKDLEFIMERFSRNGSLGFISPTFVQGISVGRRGAGTFIFDTQQQLFFLHDCKRSAGSYFSDVLISLAGRLRAHNWTFQSGEPANQAQARHHFYQMGYLNSPFAAYLPYGTAYRGKHQSLALKFAEKYRCCDFYPFINLTDTQIAHIEAQCPPQVPVAESFLTNTNSDLPQPWIYNPLQGSRLLKHLNRLESLFL